jgi:uncharacterized protein YeaC (DUF1315 family)
MKETIQSLDELIKIMNPEIHMNLKTAVELGRWANGDRLSSEQVENCLQAIIAWEQSHLPETERTGYIDTSAKQSHCDSSGHSHSHPEEQALTWKQQPGKGH